MTARTLGGVVLAFILPLASLGPAHAASVGEHADSPAVKRSSAVRTDQKCNPDKYRARNVLTTWHRRPVVTHLMTYSQPPTASRTVTKTTEMQTVISARATISSGVTVKAQNKLIGEAEGHLDMRLATAGSRTVKTSVKVTDIVKNKTNHNVAYVFFRGNNQGYGRWQHRWCSTYYVQPGDHFVGYYVYYRVGRWHSYSVYGEGAARCDGGTKGLPSLTKAAMRMGCK